MRWIANHKHKFEEKSTKISRSSSKVVSLGPVDLCEFPTLQLILKICGINGGRNSNHGHGGKQIRIWIRKQRAHSRTICCFRETLNSGLAQNLKLAWDSRLVLDLTKSNSHRETPCNHTTWTFDSSSYMHKRMKMKSNIKYQLSANLVERNHDIWH